MTPISITTQSIHLNISIGGRLYLIGASVEIRNEVIFDPAAPTILVAGSALEFEGSQRGLASASRLRAYAKELAAMLADLGVNLVTGACPGLPNDVLTEFMKNSSQGISLGLSAYSSLDEHVSGKPFAEAGFPADADITVFTGAGFEHLNVLTSSYCDAVVLLGGGLGTLLEAGAAVEQEIPVFCFLPSGGMASRIDSVMKDFIASFKSYTVRRCETISEIAEALVQSRSNMAMEGKASRMTPLIEAILDAKNIFERTVYVDIEDNLEHITYSTETDKCRLEKPCCLIDRIRIARECESADALLHALQYHRRIYRYQDVRMTFSRNSDQIIWGPSIDTLLLIRALGNAADLNGPEVVTDIGSGSGFLALWCALKYSPQTVQVVDVSSNAVGHIKAAFAQAEATPSLRVLQSDIRCGIDLAAADIVVCNPPYVPVPHSTNNPVADYEGTDLLLYLLENFRQFIKPAGRMYLVLSHLSLADRDVSTRLAELEASGYASLSIRSEVPFKVGEIISNRRWISFLVDECGLQDEPKDGYRFWHTVLVYRLIDLAS